MAAVGPLPPLDAAEWQPRANGMKVWDVTAGQGQEIKPGATVTIHYTGWLKDGNIFDTSRKELADRLPPGSEAPTGEPATFPLGRLIKGWQEGLPGVKVGGVRRLYIPYELAYGEQGRRGIPPKADLVFEIEVIKAESK